MTNTANNATISLQGKLLLAPLSLKIYPELSTYETINQVDLQLLDNIDSAGLAYLVQIKSHFPSIIFCRRFTENADIIAPIWCEFYFYIVGLNEYRRNERKIRKGITAR